MNIKQTIVACLLVISSITLGVLVAPAVSADCGGAKTSIISCSQDNSGTDAENNGVWGVLLIALNILTAGVGIAAVGGIVYASILYASAGDSSEQTKKAIEMIKNVVIGLVVFGLMFLLLNFLIPGGVFKT
jgi:hypothetical protein